ncbi:MAG: RpoL/Rpb11 RNA polymerase subunit family protein [Thermoproteota archaeon]|nr:DNA-directed RNA polymerase subunit L [Candidatus Brockarchaeota archaeon]
MRVVYRSREKGSAELEIYGETHTILNLLTSYLNRKLEKGYAAYKIEHPLKQEAVLYINTGGKDPKEALLKTIKELIKDLEELEDDIKEAASKFVS